MDISVIGMDICASEGTMVKDNQKEFKWRVPDTKSREKYKVETFLPMNQEGYFIVSEIEDEVDQGMDTSSVDKFITAMLDVVRT